MGEKPQEFEKIISVFFLSVDFEALDAELDHLNSALDQMENWSTSLHDKVAEFLKETQEQNRHVASSTTAQGTEADSDCENNSNSKSVESEATNSTDNDKCSVDGTSSSVPKKEEKSAENWKYERTKC